jgi:hypothetical protein
LKLPKSDYTLESFLEEIASNPDKYFGAKERRWLKTYVMYAKKNWLDLFAKFNPEKNGDLYYLSIPNVKEDNTQSEYYVTQFGEGLIMFFTSARQIDYEQTLQDYIRRKRGITEMWIPHDTFKRVRDYIIENYNANIYFFIAKRQWTSEIPSHFRPDYNRSIHYYAEDGNAAVKELEHMYGVGPTVIDFRMGLDSVRVSNEGLFSVRSTDRRMLRMVVDVVDNILAEQVRLHKVSTSVESRTEKVNFGDTEYQVRLVESGRILLTREMTTVSVLKLFRQLSEIDVGRSSDKGIGDEFAFIDTTINDFNGLTFSATVIDKSKGTIFGLSGSKKEMVLVPMHRTTFESFLRFYHLVAEFLDSSASLGTFSDPIAAQ